jgi:hypothetical protein
MRKDPTTSEEIRNITINLLKQKKKVSISFLLTPSFDPSFFFPFSFSRGSLYFFNFFFFFFFFFFFDMRVEMYFLNLHAVYRRPSHSLSQ